jgi:hypothetical protein
MKLHLYNINEIDSNYRQKYSLTIEDKFYECILNEEKIGYAIIKNNPNDMIYIEIESNYQNKGNGSKLFEEILKLVNGKIRVISDINNYKMKRIILNNNGIETSRDGEFIHYIIEK